MRGYALVTRSTVTAYTSQAEARAVAEQAGGSPPPSRGLDRQALNCHPWQASRPKPHHRRATLEIMVGTTE